MNKQYIVSVIGAIACLGVIGTLIPSLIPMPVQARVVDCNDTPWDPKCWQDKIIVIPPHDDCPLCPFGNILDRKEFQTIDDDWNATVNFKHNSNSVTWSFNIPNVLIDEMKTKMDTGSIQQNSSMIK